MQQPDKDLKTITPSTTPEKSTTTTNTTIPQTNIDENAIENVLCETIESSINLSPINTQGIETSSESPSTSAAANKNEMPILECAICLQTCVYPTKLPCGHIFCFLCIKGTKNRSCAMCRQIIPGELLFYPKLVNGVTELLNTKSSFDGYQWFYEGSNGWWQFDDRTSQDIEEAYKNKEKNCTILVAGHVYNIDLENMLQQRQHEQARCRRIKRDLATIPKKGVAGLHLQGNTVTTKTNYVDLTAENNESEDENQQDEVDNDQQ